MSLRLAQRGYGLGVMTDDGGRGIIWRTHILSMCDEMSPGNGGGLRRPQKFLVTEFNGVIFHLQY